MGYRIKAITLCLECKSTGGKNLYQFFVRSNDTHIHNSYIYSKYINHYEGGDFMWNYTPDLQIMNPAVYPCGFLFWFILLSILIPYVQSVLFIPPSHVCACMCIHLQYYIWHLLWIFLCSKEIWRLSLLFFFYIGLHFLGGFLFVCFF